MAGDRHDLQVTSSKRWHVPHQEVADNYAFF
jgi:hypothetical protein